MYIDNEADYERVERLLNDTLDASLSEIAARLDTRGERRDNDSVPVVVYNPLAWTRSEPVRVTLRLNAPLAGPRDEGLVIRNTDGHEMPTQVFDVRQQAPYWYTDVGFLARDVPSLGYRVFWAEPRVRLAADARFALDERPEPEAELLASSLAAAEQWSIPTGDPLTSSLAEAEGLSLSTDDTMRAYLREIERIPGLDPADELWLTMRISAAQYVHTLLDQPAAPAESVAKRGDDANWNTAAPDLMANAYDAFLSGHRRHPGPHDSYSSIQGSWPCDSCT